jgi:hypothetical protein
MWMDRQNEAIGTMLVALAAVAAFAVPNGAEAFCGSYVSGGERELFNNATQAVMMRHDQETVLSIQNDYQGPTEDFAMIVPTPVVLEKQDVKTLDDEIFSKLDRLTAPRLVEYWEKDPCETRDERAFAPTANGGANEDSGNKNVDVEAEFSVGEYDVVVLSSSESSSLETWLNNNGYNIPDGAAPYLDPYINQGSKFFVAKVDTEKVEFDDDGQAVLSPLRFHYESPQFKLPVRLGMINSQGKQDLIVNILAQNQRYQVANYPNVTIPTNIEVVNDVRNRFGKFYRSLFRETIRQNRKDGQNPVVTEYAWNAASCDPCPGPALDGSDIATLGGDVINDGGESQQGQRPGFRSGWVVTRLHARYGKDELGKDLVFEKAPPISGGRERRDEDGNLEQGAQESNLNNFQGRYIIRHPWNGPVLCANPEYGRWGGNPDGGGPSTMTSKSPTSGGSVGGEETEDQPDLEREVHDDIPELGVEANPPEGPSADRACSMTPGGDGDSVPLALLVVVGLGFGLLRWRSN